MAAEAYPGVENLEVMAEARRYNAHLLSLVVRHAGEHRQLVDFGAGAGTFAGPLTGLGYGVTAVEPDEWLRSRLARQGIQAVDQLSRLPDESVAFLYTLNVLEHIDDDLGTLETVRRKLRPGGRVLIYVPAFELLYSSMDRKVGHVRRYTAPLLRRRIAAAGLTLEDIRYVDFLGFFAALLFRMLDRGEGKINRSALVLYDRIVFPASLAFDRGFSGILGKNVVAIARRGS